MGRKPKRKSTLTILQQRKFKALEREIAPLIARCFGQKYVLTKAIREQILREVREHNVTLDDMLAEVRFQAINDIFKTCWDAMEHGRSNCIH